MISALCATGLFMIVGVLVFLYASVKVPSVDARIEAQTTVITYNDGKSEVARLATQDRENVVLAQIPVNVRYAVLAAEDHTFYTNSGIDVKSLARAVLSNLSGHATQGGSTISQQYVKNVYNARDKTYKRKINEAFLALKINKTISKDAILERYLNTIYLGRGAYGIQAAAHAYFGQNTDVSKLTVSQGAFLAGIINAPSISDPRDGATHLARAQRRWNVVADAMVTDGWLSATQRAKLKFPRTVVQVTQTSVSGQNAYLKDMVEQELIDKNILTKQQIETGGYKIVTTFDKGMVDAGVSAVKDQLPKNPPKSLKVGMASIDPRSGAIKAIYGGKGITQEINQATQDAAQGGSTFKAFGLIAALESGVSLNSYYDSSSPRYFPNPPNKKPYAVRNFGNEHFGYVNLIKATEQSINTVFAQLNVQVGPEKTQAAAFAAGIPKVTRDLNGNLVPTDLGKNLVNVLGSTNVHPIDLASAYGTFAAGGIHRSAYSVQSVSKIGTGKVIYQAPAPSTKRVFSQDAVDDLTYALQQVVNSGTGTEARKLGRPAAGKTGTSTDSKSAWFVGFTPQLVTAVALHEQAVKVVKVKGKTVRRTVILNMTGFGGVANVTGGTFPAKIWTQYMQAALKNTKVIDFPQPVYGGVATNAPQPTSQPTPTPTSQPTFTQPSQQPSNTGQPSPTNLPPSDTPRPSASDAQPTSTPPSAQQSGSPNGK